MKPSRCADNSGHRGGFFVSGSLAGWSLGSESGASQFAPPATACRVLPPEAGELPRLAPRLDRFAGAGFSSSVPVAASGAAAASRGLPDWRMAPLASIRPTSSAACCIP